MVYLLFSATNPGSWQRIVALLFFILAISTDGLDGAIARRTGKVTNLGKILDPIADKALIGGSLISLSILGEVSWWITGLILLREAIVTIYRLVVIKREVIAAAFWGKLKTILQAVAIGAVISPIEIWIPLWSSFEQVLLWAALAVTIYSGLLVLRPGKQNGR